MPDCSSLSFDAMPVGYRNMHSRERHDKHHAGCNILHAVLWRGVNVLITLHHLLSKYIYSEIQTTTVEIETKKHGITEIHTKMSCTKVLLTKLKWLFINSACKFSQRWSDRNTQFQCHSTYLLIISQLFKPTTNKKCYGKGHCSPYAHVEGVTEMHTRITMLDVILDL